MYSKSRRLSTISKISKVTENTEDNDFDSIDIAASEFDDSSLSLVNEITQEEKDSDDDDADTIALLNRISPEVLERVTNIFMKFRNPTNFEYQNEIFSPTTAMLKKRGTIDMTKFQDKQKNDYGLNIHRLKQWVNENSLVLLNKEETMQEIALAKVRGFIQATGN